MSLTGQPAVQPAASSGPHLGPVRSLRSIIDDIDDIDAEVILISDQGFADEELSSMFANACGSGCR
jgi:hypothetical protein